MPENRFFLSFIPPAGSSTTLDEEELRHLRVMRPLAGDVVTLIDGKGHLAEAHISEITKRTCDLIIDKVDYFNPPSFEIIIAQAIPKKTKIDFILEKGTELGMTKILLFPGDYSEKDQFSESQLIRHEKLIIAALKQSGSLWKPKIEIGETIYHWKNLEYPIYFGDLRENAPPFLSLWKKNPPSKGAIFVVGPEKGLSEKEIKHLESLGGQGVGLNANILRTETAAIAAITLMSHFGLS